MAGKNLYQKINAIMGRVDYVQKEKKAGMRYSIVSHDSVTALLRPEIQKEGIVYYVSDTKLEQNGNKTMVIATVRFVNMDDPSEFLETSVPGHGIDDQDKGPGKAISYAVKYALLKTFGLETGDDPDNDQDVKHSPSKPDTSAVQRQQERELSDSSDREFTVKTYETAVSKAGKEYAKVTAEDDSVILVFGPNIRNLVSGNAYRASGKTDEKGTFLVFGEMEDLSQSPF